MSEPKVSTVELEVIPESTPEQKPEALLTEEQLIDQGLLPQEIESAKKYGLIAKEEAPEEQKPAEDPKKEDETPKPEDEKTAEEIVDKADEYERMFKDPDLEKKNLANYTRHEKGTYWRMKNEIKKRQAAEEERSYVEIQLKAAREREEKILAELESLKKSKEEDPLSIEDQKPKENLDEKIKEDRKKQEEEDREYKARKLHNTLIEFENDARPRYDDFDEAVKLADDIFKNANTLFKDDEVMQTKVFHLARSLQLAIADADKFKGRKYTPADMVYEIGKLHPNYKAPAPSGEKSGKEKEGNLDPAKLKKIAENAGKRSSASIAGGPARRVVNFEDLTLQDLADMPPEKFRTVPKEIRQRILRG